MKGLNNWATVILVAILGLLLGLVSAIPARSASVDVGQHIHDAITNDPAKGVAIPRTTYTFHHVIRLHNQTGKATSIRVSDYSTVMQTRSISLGPCSDCSLTLDFPVNFAAWSCGEHELRWTVNVPSNSSGNRQFTTSRSYVTLAGCTTKRHDRSSSWQAGGGGWYTGLLYDIAILQTPRSQLVAGGQIQARVQSSATVGCIFVNPDFHNGSHGTRLGSCWSGTGTATRTLPSWLATGDRVVLYATHGGHSAGLYSLTIGTRTDEWQSWWAKDGIVLP